MDTFAKMLEVAKLFSNSGGHSAPVDLMLGLVLPSYEAKKRPSENRCKHECCNPRKIEPERVRAAPRQHESRVDRKEYQYCGSVPHWISTGNKSSGRPSQEA